MSLERSEHFLVRFTGKNYSAWAFQFQIFVKGKELWGHIAGTVPAPDSEQEKEKYVKWEVKDAQIMSWILGSMEHSMLLNLKPYKSSREMWDYLKKVYNQSNTARRFQLELELGQLSQGSMSIQEFYSSFVNLWAEYTDIVYARRKGDIDTRYIEPLPQGSTTKFEFDNMIVGQVIPSNFIPSIEKGFKEAANSGSLIGHPVENLRIALTDGAAHAVDSSELAFKLASIYAFRQCYTAAKPVILEPVMLVELKVPTEFQGTVAGDINKRKGVIVGNDQDGDDSIITVHVPLNNMFGYSTSLRSMTQGKGEFTMEYKEHSPVSQDVQMQLVNTYMASKGAE